MSMIRGQGCAAIQFGSAAQQRTTAEQFGSHSETWGHLRLIVTLGTLTDKHLHPAMNTIYLLIVQLLYFETPFLFCASPSFWSLLHTSRFLRQSMARLNLIRPIVWLLTTIKQLSIYFILTYKKQNNFDSFLNYESGNTKRADSQVVRRGQKR